MIFASQRLSARERQRQLLLDLPWPSDLSEDELRMRIAELLELGATEAQIEAKLTESGIAPDRTPGLIESARAHAAAARQSVRRFNRTVGLVALLAGVVVVVTSWLTVNDAVLYLPGVAAIVFGLMRLLRAFERGATPR